MLTIGLQCLNICTDKSILNYWTTVCSGVEVNTGSMAELQENSKTRQHG